MFVKLTVIPWMYKCNTCGENITERGAIGIRLDKNYYFHNNQKCRVFLWSKDDTGTNVKEMQPAINE